MSQFMSGNSYRTSAHESGCFAFSGNVHVRSANFGGQIGA